jgi:hypothetical protein
MQDNGARREIKMNIATISLFLCGVSQLPNAEAARFQDNSRYYSPCPSSTTGEVYVSPDDPPLLCSMLTDITGRRCVAVAAVEDQD